MQFFVSVHVDVALERGALEVDVLCVGLEFGERNLVGVL